MNRQGTTKELLGIMTDPGKSSGRPPADSPPVARPPRSPAFVRTVVILCAMLALFGVVLVRWISFDPTSYARGLSGRIDVLGPADVNDLRALQSMDRGSSTELDAKAMTDRFKRVEADRHAMQMRYHRGSSFCARYWTDASLPNAANAQEAAKAIIQAGLSNKLEDLDAEARRWELDQDAESHAADHAQEVLAYMSQRDPLWTRLGVWLRHSATKSALEQAMRPSPALDQRHLAGEDVQRGKAIWSKFGKLTPALILVARWRSNIDLSASHLRLVHPGMTAAEASAALRPPSKGPPPMDISLAVDQDQRVAIVRWEAPERCLVYANDKPLIGPTTADVIRELGQPLPTDEPNVLAYDREGYRQRILFFDGKIAAVELRKTELAK